LCSISCEEKRGHVFILFPALWKGQKKGVAGAPLHIHPEGAPITFRGKKGSLCPRCVHIDKEKEESLDRAPHGSNK